MRAAELNLGWSVAWKASVGAVVLGGGGLAFCVVSLIGLPGQDPSQRAFGVVVGLILALIGGAAVFGVRRFALRAHLDDDGLRFTRRGGALELRWDEITSIGLTAEKRWSGRSRAWFFTLSFTLVADREDLALWREADGYRYALGQLGRAGRQLDRELARGGTRYTGLQQVVA